MEYDYQGQYRERKEKYLKKHPDSSELEMLKSEVKFHRKHLKELKKEKVTRKHPQAWKDFAIKDQRRYLQFIEGKLEVAEIKNENNKPDKSPKSILIDGKKPNIEERYYIACKIFNIDEVIRSKNILQSKKDILLATLLGINQQTARELNNGTYQKRTSALRIPILDKYISDLNE